MQLQSNLWRAREGIPSITGLLNPRQTGDSSSLLPVRRLVVPKIWTDQFAWEWTLYHQTTDSFGKCLGILKGMFFSSLCSRVGRVVSERTVTGVAIARTLSIFLFAVNSKGWTWTGRLTQNKNKQKRMRTWTSIVDWRKKTTHWFHIRT